ncbi:MAG: MBL fold metallo-hydrolase [Verrucomicrobiales bacterium]
MSSEKSPFTFTFLGTATSVGVPVIGCRCPVCTSSDPRNKRTRSSALIRTPQGNLLIDAGPDLRQQALREDLRTLEAVLFTHPHLDHILGFDEIRAFCWHREEKIPFYGSPETLGELERLFPWAYPPHEPPQNYVRPVSRPLEAPIELLGLKITPIDVIHGATRTYGYRLDRPGGKSLAFISDVKTIPAASKELLRGLDHLALDGLHYRGHSNHLSVDEAIALADELSARHLHLTHLSHEVDHADEHHYPDHVTFAYDGLRLAI